MSDKLYLASAGFTRRAYNGLKLVLEVECCPVLDVFPNGFLVARGERTARVTPTHFHPEMEVSACCGRAHAWCDHLGRTRWMCRLLARLLAERCDWHSGQYAVAAARSALEIRRVLSNLPLNPALIIYSNDTNDEETENAG